MNDDKSFLAIKGESSLLDCSLRELMSNSDAKIIAQGNKLSLQVQDDNLTMRVDINRYPLGETRTVSLTPIKSIDNQIDFENTIMQRLNEGETQSEIAFTMGISQSRVSQIKKKNTLKGGD